MIIDPKKTARSRTAHIKIDHRVSSAVNLDSVERACSAVNSNLVGVDLRTGVMLAVPYVAPTNCMFHYRHIQKLFR